MVVMFVRIVRVVMFVRIIRVVRLIRGLLRLLILFIGVISDTLFTGTHVPFRDSKITRLLQVTILIALIINHALDPIYKSNYSIIQA